MAAESVNEGTLQYHILAPEVAIPEPIFVLKHDETFALFNHFGDIDPAARHEEGLYHCGTRHLSKLALTLANGRPLLLSAAARRDNLLIAADLTNPDIYLQGRIVLPRGSLHIYRTKLVWESSCHEAIHVRNFTDQSVEIGLALVFAADYADIFEIRGEKRPRRGRLLEPRIGSSSIELRYRGLDNVTRLTRISCTPAPQRVTGDEMRFIFRLGSHEEHVLSVNVECETQAADAPPALSSGQPASHAVALARAEQMRATEARLPCNVRSSYEPFNAWLDRSAADLTMLLSHTPHGLYPYAGVPWFDTPFGRDGIITALECLWLAPQVARGVLSFLAATQARDFDAQRDAEPGKILHEMRHGEMAALKEIPFDQYYGSVDSTPLFVMLAGAYYRRTADLAMIEAIWPNVLAALEWLERYGDRDRDGFIEYHRRSQQGLVQQGWKDSQDSIFHADGHLAEGPIALCEVQGYTYAAHHAAAELATALGHAQVARTQQEAARELSKRFEERFWVEEIGFYALALDGEKRPCQVRSSNAGQCLFTGIATPEHARAIAKALTEEPFFSGWGVRTIADTEKRYNPMAYHNGSIWPHDNALIAAGVTHAPDKELAERIFSAQLEAAGYFDSCRLPELFCGFRRRPGKPPTSYPVACSPQAWAAGAVFLLLEACLGISIDAPGSRIVLRHPRLPARMDTLTIRNLTVGEGSVDLILHGYPDSVGLNVEKRQGQVDVVMAS